MAVAERPVDSENFWNSPDTVADNPSPSDEVRRVTSSTYLGNTIEYRDAILAGVTAALIFGRLFLSGPSPTVATITSFGTLATGYLCRPLGGLLFGNLGDRFGRNSMLPTLALAVLAFLLLRAIDTLFWAIDTNSTVLLFAAFVTAFVVAQAISAARLGTVRTEVP